MNKKILILSLVAVAILVLVSSSSAVDVNPERGNQPPEPPYISGPREPKLGVEYEYTFVSEDPDGDNISYLIDWGDGNITGWTMYAPSGTMMTFCHAWYSSGYYLIKAKAKDIYGAESDWSSWYFNIPPVKEIITYIHGKVTSFEVLDGFIIRDVVITADNISIRGWKWDNYVPGLLVDFQNYVEYIHAPRFFCFQYLSNRIWGIAFGDIEWS